MPKPPLNDATYVQHALTSLKAQGLRLTHPRQRVVGVLAEATFPLSAYDIKALLDEQGTPVDTVSVYRVLDCLEQLHLIHRVGNTGKVVSCQRTHTPCQYHHEVKPYHVQEHHWHVLLVCVGCGQVAEAETSPHLNAFAQQLVSQQGFTPQAGALEVKGWCRGCQLANSNP
jgi:Fur family zinc uptake transcriptional regulator